MSFRISGEFMLAAIFITFFLAIAFILFTIFSGVYFGEQGLEAKFNDSVQSSMSDDQQDIFSSRMGNLRFFFQLAGVAIVGLCFGLLVIFGFRGRDEGGE